MVLNQIENKKGSLMPWLSLIIYAAHFKMLFLRWSLHNVGRKSPDQNKES